jgi:hypothetical protein
MERALQVIDQERRIDEEPVSPPCDSRGNALPDSR